MNLVLSARKDHEEARERVRRSRTRVAAIQDRPGLRECGARLARLDPTVSKVPQVRRATKVIPATQEIRGPQARGENEARKATREIQEIPASGDLGARKATQETLATRENADLEARKETWENADLGVVRVLPDLREILGRGDRKDQGARTANEASTALADVAADMKGHSSTATKSSSSLAPSCLAIREGLSDSSMRSSMAMR